MMPRATTIQDMSGRPKTTKELKARGVAHTLTSDGRPKVTQGALTDALNALGQKVTGRMSNTQLGAHLLKAGAADVAAGQHDTAMRDWYGPHARQMEHGFHRMFGYADHPDDPDQVFAKVLVGLTSPGNNPNQNVDTAVRMLKAAGGDVTKIPRGNASGFTRWLTRHVHGGGTIPHAYLGDFGGDEFGRPIEAVEPGNPHAAGEWAHRHGYTRDNQVSYYGLPAYYDPKRKRVTHVQRRGKWEPVAFTHGHDVVTGATGGPAIVEKRARTLPRGSERIHLPVLDELGRLQPKRWVAYAKSLGVGIHGLHELIREKGREGAAKFLTTEHDPQDVIDARARLVSKSGKATPDYLPPGDRLAGFLMFGPKIGSFMANIHDSHTLGKYLTADMWFARWFRRHLGVIQGNKEPITRQQRQEMYHAAEQIRRHTGVDSIAQLQAILWGAEQALYRSYHQKADSGNLLDATKRAMRRHFGLESAERSTRRPSGHVRVDAPTSRRTMEELNTEGLL